MLAMEHETNELVRDFVKLALYTGHAAATSCRCNGQTCTLNAKNGTSRGPERRATDRAADPRGHRGSGNRRKKAPQAAILFRVPWFRRMRSFGGATRGLGAHAGARGTALGLVEALAEKATAKTFDYQLALEEAIDFPVQTIERYTPLAEKHGLRFAALRDA